MSLLGYPHYSARQPADQGAGRGSRVGAGWGREEKKDRIHRIHRISGVVTCARPHTGRHEDEARAAGRFGVRRPSAALARQDPRPARQRRPAERPRQASRLVVPTSFEEGPRLRLAVRKARLRRDSGRRTGGSEDSARNDNGRVAVLRQACRPARAGAEPRCWPAERPRQASRLVVPTSFEEGPRLRLAVRKARQRRDSGRRTGGSADSARNDNGRAAVLRQAHRPALGRQQALRRPDAAGSARSREACRLQTPGVPRADAAADRADGAEDPGGRNGAARQQRSKSRP